MVSVFEEVQAGRYKLGGVASETGGRAMLPQAAAGGE